MKKKRRWEVNVCGFEAGIGFTTVVEAHTKSEARALVKRQAHIKRLPIGTTVILLEDEK